MVRIETGEASKRTVETIKYGDELIFALELADEFKDEVDSYAISVELYKQRKGPKPEKPQPSLHFMGRNIFDHVLIRMKAIRSSDLESTLKFLNYKHSCSLLFYTEHFLRNNIEIELATRVCLYLIKTY